MSRPMRRLALLLVILLIPAAAKATPTEALHRVSFRIHVDVAASMDLALLQERLEDARTELQGFHGSPDIPCCTRIEEMSFTTFGVSGDELDIVESQADFSALRALGDGVYIVQSLHWCGEVGSFLGCANRPGDFVVITLDAEDLHLFGQVLAHERGHNAGLIHVSEPPCNLMSPASGGGCIDTSQCNAFVAKADSVGGSCACLADQLLDPPQPNGISCSDVFGTGLCSGGMCGDMISLAGVRLLASGGSEDPDTGAPDDLIEMSAVSGGWGELGAIGSEVNGLAFAVGWNILFGVASQIAGNDRLIQVDPETGASTQIGTLDRTGVVGLAWDPAAQALLGAEVRPYSGIWDETIILRINPIDASVSEVGAVDSLFAGGVEGLAYDPVIQTLYGSTTSGLKWIDISSCRPFCIATDVEDPIVSQNRTFFGKTGIALDPGTGLLFGVSPEHRSVSSKLDVINPITLERYGAGIAGFTPGALALTAMPRRSPVCSDGIDNDGDGLTDFPEDPICESSEGTSEEEPLLQVTPQSRDQRSCINALNKNLARVSKARGKQIYDCIRDDARGRLTMTIEECLEADRRGRVAKAMARSASDEAKNCDTPFPDFGATDAATVNTAGVEEQTSLIRALLGPGLDASVLTEVADRDTSRCQRSVSQSTHRCQDTKLKEFNKCKKGGLKNGSIGNSVALESCMGEDRKGRIARMCSAVTGRIRSAIDNKCAGLDLSRAFPELGLTPGCDTNDHAELARCLDEIVECRVCLMLNRADGLNRDCDELDDGVVDQSCP